MAVDDSELTFIGGHWALALVPYVLLAAGLLLIAALWLYRQIYLPLRRVMGSLEAGRGRNQVDALRQPGGSELDLVQSMVEDDRRQREAMQTMLTQVQESVREKLLLSLFRDGLPETQLAQLSESGQLPPRVGTYAVICLEWHRTADGSQQDEDVLCGVRLSLAAEAACRQLGAVWRVQVNPSQTAWLIALSGCENSFGEQVRQLRLRLDQEGNAIGCQCSLGGAGPCGGLETAKQMYELARQEAQRWGYYRQDLERDPREYSSVRQKIDQALRLTTGHLQRDAVDWDNLVDELVRSDSEEGVQGLRLLLDLFMEEMIRLQIDPEDDWLKLRQSLGSSELRSEAGGPIVGQVKEFVRLSAARLQAKTQSRQYQHIIRAQEYLAEHFGDSGLSLEMVSEQIGTTGPYLSHLFSSHLSCGFLDYLNRYRISQARKLLKATDLTVAEIGLKCGFNSPQSFIRVFKKYVGRTPGQYRSERGDVQP